MFHGIPPARVFHGFPRGDSVPSLTTATYHRLVCTLPSLPPSTPRHNHLITGGVLRVAAHARRLDRCRQLTRVICSLFSTHWCRGFVISCGNSFDHRYVYVRTQRVLSLRDSFGWRHILSTCDGCGKPESVVVYTCLSHVSLGVCIASRSYGHIYYAGAG